MYKRIILVFFALLLLFICVGCGEQNNSDSDQQTSEKVNNDDSLQTSNNDSSHEQAINAKEPLDIIQVFFERYYGAYASLQSPNFTDIVEVNDNTYVFIKLLDYKIEFYRKFEREFSDINVEITVLSCKEQDTKTFYHAHMKLKKQFGATFDIEMEKRVDLYMITKLQRLDTEYEDVVLSVEEVVEDNPGFTYMQAVDKYFIDRTNRLINEN